MLKGGGATTRTLPVSALPVSALPVSALPVSALPVSALPVSAGLLNDTDASVDALTAYRQAGERARRSLFH